MNAEAVIDKAWFFDECRMFRRAMCHKPNSICAIDKAYGSLFYAVNRTPHKGPDAEAIGNMWDSISMEWMRRKELMMLHSHPIGTEDDRTIFPKDEA